MFGSRRDHRRPDIPNRPLEQLTGFVLGLVLLAIGWILVAASQGESRPSANEAIEVAIILALLTAALGLVSLVALLHTRAKRDR
ncbi:MAG: hypothetical protein IT428_03490 [Planctomycetaceae bacterium]|nr:hypothetical protein [Planctomycetaceae bacterium]